MMLILESEPWLQALKIAWHWALFMNDCRRFPMHRPVDGLKEWQVAGLRFVLSRFENGLTEQETSILRLRLGLKDGRPRSPEQIEAELGVTSETVRQLQQHAVANFLRRRFPDAHEDGKDSTG
jgi:Sigma-70, region 4